MAEDPDKTVQDISMVVEMAQACLSAGLEIIKADEAGSKNLLERGADMYSAALESYLGKGKVRDAAELCTKVRKQLVDVKRPDLAKPFVEKAKSLYEFLHMHYVGEVEKNDAEGRPEICAQLCYDAANLFENEGLNEIAADFRRVSQKYLTMNRQMSTHPE